MERGAASWPRRFASGDGSARKALLHLLVSALCLRPTAWRHRSRRAGSDSGLFRALLQHQAFRAVVPGQAKLRSFLLTSLNHFLTNEYHRRQAQKRGGGQPFISFDAFPSAPASTQMFGRPNTAEFTRQQLRRRSSLQMELVTADLLVPVCRRAAPECSDVRTRLDNTDTQQAQNLVRSFLAFAECDVQHAYVCFYDDNDSPSVHGCAGLTRKFVPKMSFWAVRQLYQLLGEYRFRRIVKKGQGDLFVYEFEHGDDPKRVIWGPGRRPARARTKRTTTCPARRKRHSVDCRPFRSRWPAWPPRRTRLRSRPGTRPVPRPSR